MKLGEYIKHLQDLQDKYAGLDIEVVQPHPTRLTNVGRYVRPAKTPEVWPAEAEAANLCLVRDDASPLDPATEPKGSGPDGVIIVFDRD